MRGTRAKHLRRVAAAFEPAKRGLGCDDRPLYKWLKEVWKRRAPEQAYSALRRIK